LDEDERNLVKGIVINKFRGDVKLFLPAVEFLENKTGKPVLGILPYIEKLGIDDEDSVSLDDKISSGGEINIAVIRLNKLSNFTDFDSLAGEPDVNLFYAKTAAELDAADLIILPGSKNTSEDLIWLKENNFVAQILKKPVIGICGGFQMLVRKIFDPNKTESSHVELDGLNLLPLETTFSENKFTKQITVDAADFEFLGSHIHAENLEGYEIHSGVTNLDGKKFIATENVLGTYIHGIFDNDNFRRQILNAIRRKKNLPPLEVTRNFRADKQKNYERLAKIVRQNLNMDLLNKIIFN
jgi:adenosylcobyric acid synthase